MAFLGIALLAALACGRPARRRSDLTVAIPGYPAALLPNRIPEEISLSVQKNVYESLTTFDAGLGLVPSLATSWRTPDERTWIFSIKRGVLLHDGRRLDAKVVAEGLLRAVQDPQTNPPLWNIQAIRAEDPATLVITTELPYPTLAERLAWVQIAVPPRQAGAQPLGTGPYVLIRSDPGKGVIELEAFRRHHGGAPSIGRLIFRVIADPRERAAAIGRGAVDLAMDVPMRSLPSLRADARLATAVHPGVRVILLGMNERKGPFSDRRVRRAVAFAMDRESLVNGPLGGFASPAFQIVAPGVYGYTDHVPPVGRDVSGARSLLAEAGHGNGLKVRLDLVPGKYAAIEEVAQEVVRQLREAGIEAIPRKSAFPEFLGRLRKGDYDLSLFGWLTLTDAATSYNYLLHTPTSRAGSSNTVGFSDAEVDRAVDGALLESSPEKRQILLDSVMRKVLEEVPVVPLYTQWDIYAFDRDLQFVPRLDRFIVGAQLAWGAAAR